MSNVYLEKLFIKEPVTYARKLHRLIATDSFCSSGDKNIFMLVSGGGEEGVSQWVPEVLLLFRIDVRGSSESKEYSFLQFMKVTCLMYAVDETLQMVW